MNTGSPQNATASEEKASLETFVKQLERKKQVLEEAQKLHDLLNFRVNNAKRHLDSVKMERFKLEGAAQEMEIRVKTVELKEQELRKEAEQTPKLVAEVMRNRNELLKAQDKLNDELAEEVMKVADKYHQMRKFHQKDSLLSAMHHLSNIDDSLNNELHDFQSQEQENSSQPVDDKWSEIERPHLIQFLVCEEENSIVNNMRMLSEHLTGVISLVQTNDECLQSETDKVNIEIASLSEEMSRLKEVWGL